MQKFHKILQLILLAYFVVLLVFFIAFDTLGDLLGVAEVTSDTVVTVMLIGLSIFLVAWLVGKGVRSSLQGNLKKREAEINSLKAKIYDFEHPAAPAKPASETPAKAPEGEAKDEPSSQNYAEE